MRKAWCWCYCCQRRLEASRHGGFACCGRHWKVEDSQPRPRHEVFEVDAEVLGALAVRSLAFLARWPGRRPHGLKALVETLGQRLGATPAPSKGTP